MDAVGTGESGRVAYLIKCFPRASETFILHEIIELERQGVPLHIFSLLEPGADKLPAAVEQVQAPVTYLPRRPLSLLAATLRRLRRSPGRLLEVALTEFIRSPQWATVKHLSYAAELAEQLESAGITHVHAHYANTPAAVAQLVEQLTGISYSFTAHAKDIYLTRPASLIHRMRAARFVVTCTAYNQSYLTGLLEKPLEQPVHCIYHGLDLQLFERAEQPEAATAVERPLILAVARLVEKKGLPYLLDACRLLADQGYDFRCRLVGEGPLRGQLEQQIRDLALDKRVTLWGQEAHERVIAMYREATIVALPCIVGEDGDRDGIPNALVEAMSLGVPVVSTPISGVPELITDEANGLLVPPHDAIALALSLSRLLDDAALRQRLARAGRETVMTNFDMARNASRLRQLLDHVAMVGNSAGVPQYANPEAALNEGAVLAEPGR
jgi:glycosyltransferase involved in cell wall biosynthesis